MHARFGYVRIVVGDLARSLGFYTSVLGLVEKHRIEFTGPDVAEVVLADADGRECLVLASGPAMPVHSGSPAWAPIVVTVDDAVAAADEIRAAGHELAIDPPLSIEGVSALTMAVDPDGYLVEIISAAQPIDVSAVGAAGPMPHPAPHIHERLLG